MKSLTRLPLRGQRQNCFRVLASRFILCQRTLCPDSENTYNWLDARIIVLRYPAINGKLINLDISFDKTSINLDWMFVLAAYSDCAGHLDT